MSNPAMKASQRVAVVGSISPVSQGAGTATSAWIDATTFHNYLAILKTGVLGASATLDAKIQQATDNAGAGVKDVTGRAITQLVKASNDNNQAEIDLKQEDLDFAASIHLFFDQNLTAFRWIFRLGGQPYLSGPVAAAKGAGTKSHFVCIENR